ncbi:hypothetical protein SAMN05444395_101619 [Flavobacterium fryxellicola]|uniref:Uncharacterized protein n=1 Tax=Flavobacterium fryxellicola TaxID=249352 RepID=A0A168AEU5_9FLAO|nr:hypothetical protein [Flavobacterium fryxellicola]OAB31405.1 hypothetical protein FBFR_00795 [Flavobacterium fryxellicola]SHN54127.1 hypothetical protein SAMN05444395_101619 [Flavobacterium fryxellicola]
MSERWKYQIKTGLPWGIFMIVFMILFEIKEVSFIDQVSQPFFYFKAVAYILLGIFVLGYSSWKSKIKRQTK